MWTQWVPPFVWGATSLCAVSTEESRAGEELGGPILADSSSPLSMLFASLSLLVGLLIQTENVVMYISYPQHADPGRKQYPKLVIPVSHGGKADLANLTVGIFPSLGWLDGYFSPNVDSGVLIPMFEKNNQSPALQAGFFELPNSSGEIQRYHSTWWTRVKPALLCVAGMIWVRVNLGGRQKKKRKKRENYISATKTTSVHEKETNALLHSICCVPQNTEVEAGSGTRECRRKEVRPAPRGRLAHPDCSASALRSQFLHSLVELPGKSKPSVLAI